MKKDKQEEQKKFEAWLTKNGYKEAWKVMPVGNDTPLGSEFFVVSKEQLVSQYEKSKQVNRIFDIWDPWEEKKEE